MAGSKDRGFAAVVAAYAGSTGVSLRTAQRHAKSGHPDWVRYSQATLVSAVAKREQPLTTVEVEVMAAVSPGHPPAMPAELDVDESQLSESGRMLKACWEMWHAHFQLWKSCRGGTIDKMGNVTPPDHAMACVHASLMMKLRADFEKAQRVHTQWQIDDRSLIPANEFAAFRAQFLIPLRNLMRNMPAEMAPLVNPADQPRAIRGGEQYLQQRVQPQLQLCAEALDRMCPPRKGAAA